MKYRPSRVEGKAGVIYYRITQGREVRNINTDYKLFIDEWDSNLSKAIPQPHRADRESYVESVNHRITLDLSRLSQIILSLDCKWGDHTVETILEIFRSQVVGITLFDYMQDVMIKLAESNKVRAVETYKATLSSFKKFRGDKDLFLVDVTSDLIIDYESYLIAKNITRNTTSFYMRILRAVYNRAVKEGLVKQQFPFKQVYTGIDKRAGQELSLEEVRLIKNIDLSLYANLDFARDMFMLSFYMQGMSLANMSTLMKSSINGDILTYQIYKEGVQFHLKWTALMQEIVTKHSVADSPYLLPIIEGVEGDNRTQYNSTTVRINNHLKKISAMLSLPIPITMSVAKCSWDAIAKSMNIPKITISQEVEPNAMNSFDVASSKICTIIYDQSSNLILQQL